ncbi:MAG: class I SAM-dependent methyltransferase [Nanoarchaeota archaeon]
MIEKRFSGSESLEYDLVYRTAFGPARMAEKVIGRILTERFEKRDDSTFRVLELGCGTGITTEIILNADPRIIVDAVDNENNMIVQIGSKLRKQNLAGRVNLFELDAEEACRTLRAKYDAIVTAFMIHNLPRTKRDSLINAVYCALGVDKLFINADKIAQDDPKAHEKSLAWQMEQFKKFDRIGKPELRTYWEQHYLRDNQDDLILKESEFTNRLEVTGFLDVQRVFRRHTEAVYVASTRSKSYLETIE